MTYKDLESLNELLLKQSKVSYAIKQMKYEVISGGLLPIIKPLYPTVQRKTICITLSALLQDIIRGDICLLNFDRLSIDDIRSVLETFEDKR